MLCYIMYNHINPCVCYFQVSFIKKLLNMNRKRKPRRPKGDGDVWDLCKAGHHEQSTVDHRFILNSTFSVHIMSLALSVTFSLLTKLLFLEDGESQLKVFSVLLFLRCKTQCVLKTTRLLSLVNLSNLV